MNVSVVIASLNSFDTLKESLLNWLQLPINELIVVDGGSTDGTQEFLKFAGQSDYRIKFTIDKRSGLSFARNTGTRLANSPLVLHAGPDNSIPVETLEAMIDALDSASLVSCRTVVSSGNRYKDMVLNVSKSRLAAGEDLEVVGTPYLALKELFSRYPFNEMVRDSDDTFFCEEIRSHGHKIVRLDSVCFESGFDSIASLKSRYVRWGRSDAEFYYRRSQEMSLIGRIKSFTRAFWIEVISPARHSPIALYLVSLPFLALLGYLRFRAFQAALSEQGRG